MIKFYKKLVVTCCFFVVTSCSILNLNSSFDSAQVPPVVKESHRQTAWQLHQANMHKLKYNNSWTLGARVGITSKENSGSSHLEWFSDPGFYKITLNNALTFGEIVITSVNHSNNSKIELIYDNKKYKADNPNQLLEKLTGLRLPISELQFWIFGLPSPNYPIENFKLNNYAALESIRQSGFNISYDNYRVVNTHTLPGKILIKSPGLHIKVQIEDWKV